MSGATSATATNRGVAGYVRRDCDRRVTRVVMSIVVNAHTVDSTTDDEKPCNGVAEQTRWE